MNNVRYGEVAFTSDGHLYWQKQGSGKLTVLDEHSPGWKDAGSSPGRNLLGADGSRLVFSSTGAGPIGLQWFEQPSFLAQ